MIEQRGNQERGAGSKDPVPGRAGSAPAPEEDPGSLRGKRGSCVGLEEEETPHGTLGLSSEYNGLLDFLDPHLQDSTKRSNS